MDRSFYRFALSFRGGAKDDLNAYICGSICLMI